MLVLTRKQSQLIQIGDNIVIKVIRTGPGTVKLGIDAPHDVRVMRGELDGVLIQQYEEEGAAGKRAPKKPSSPSASQSEPLSPNSRRAELNDEEEAVSHVSRRKPRGCVA